MPKVTDGNGTTFTTRPTWRDLGAVIAGSAVGLSLAMAVASWFGFAPVDVADDARWRERTSVQLSVLNEKLTSGMTQLKDHSDGSFAAHAMIEERLDLIERSCCPISPRIRPSFVPPGQDDKP